MVQRQLTIEHFNENEHRIGAGKNLHEGKEGVKEKDLGNHSGQSKKIKKVKPNLTQNMNTP